MTVMDWSTVNPETEIRDRIDMLRADQRHHVQQAEQAVTAAEAAIAADTAEIAALLHDLTTLIPTQNGFACPQCGRPALFRHGRTVECINGHQWQPDG